MRRSKCARITREAIIGTRKWFWFDSKPVKRRKRSDIQGLLRKNLRVRTISGGVTTVHSSVGKSKVRQVRNNRLNITNLIKICGTRMYLEAWQLPSFITLIVKNWKKRT